MTSPRKVFGEATHQSDPEIEAVAKLQDSTRYLLEHSGHQWNRHLIASLRRQTISRLLYYNNLYQQIVPIPGVICEFGVQWGATMALLTNLRGIYEPYNYTRRIVGFDTFQGFPSVDERDGGFASKGDYSTGDRHVVELSRLLAIHEQFSPIAHVQKHELVRGDACETVPAWLRDNPAEIIAMAILDFDIYAPTKTVLTNIVPRLTKGSLLVFDELSCPHFPGETLALMETMNFEGATGPITFEPALAISKAVPILKVKDGDFVFVETLLP